MLGLLMLIHLVDGAKPGHQVIHSGRVLAQVMVEAEDGRLVFCNLSISHVSSEPNNFLIEAISSYIIVIYRRIA